MRRLVLARLVALDDADKGAVISWAMNSTAFDNLWVPPEYHLTFGALLLLYVRQRAKWTG